MLVDSTILFHKNKWWLFTNIADPEGTSPHNELYLFSSDNLLSHNWKSHPMNPVISDVKRARPAGKIIEHKGILYPSIPVLQSPVWLWNETEWNRYPDRKWLLRKRNCFHWAKMGQKAEGSAHPVSWKQTDNDWRLLEYIWRITVKATLSEWTGFQRTFLFPDPLWQINQDYDKLIGIQ